MKKLLAAGGVAFIALPTLLLTLTAAMLTGTAAASPCGPAGPAQQVQGVPLDAEQLANAQTIAATTSSAGMPSRAAVVAVATALQESGLRNVGYGDRDSLGLFQQRASWGPAGVRLDPVAATILFLRALNAVRHWKLLPAAVASDQVQHSAFPTAVTRWETLASALVAMYWPVNIGGSTPPSTSTPGSSPPAGSASNCPGEGSESSSGEGTSGGGVTTLPPGFALPTVTQQGTVVAFALAQLGQPYRWGGAGPGGWDCSGLTMRAWGAAGVPLPRTTFQQVLAGAPVPSTAAMQPGDLIFIAGSDGTPANPGHVGLYIGLVNSLPYLVDAPETGRTVEITPVSTWAGLIVAIRRPTSHY
jgi:cell wall-associated NlpC family hydrolase